MRARGRIWLVVMMAALVAATAACPPTGTFVPDDPDAGFTEDGITANDIGVPCIFDPRTGENPTNQCRGGLECIIVPRTVRDAALLSQGPTGQDTTLGVLLPLLEDHFTIYNDDGTDTGYCTLVGNAQAPPACPLGTIIKGFRSSAPGGVAFACLKPCEVSAECGTGRVCDARYFDDGGFNPLTGQVALNGGTGFCVRPCEVDYPDCTRTGFAPLNERGELTSQVAAIDITGGRICNVNSGICEQNLAAGTGNNGDPCLSSADCVEGAACIQLDARRERPLDQTGYCATRCFVDQDTGPNGTCGTDFCQEGLNYGYDILPAFDPDGLFANVVPTFDETGATRAFNGLCFDRCVEGFPCQAEGTVCDAIDGNALAAGWNGVSMCVPPEIALQAP